MYLLILILSLCHLQSSLFEGYEGRDALPPAQVIAALETESVWTIRHSIFVEQIAANPQGWAVNYDRRAARIAGGREICEIIYATMFPTPIDREAAGGEDIIVGKEQKKKQLL